LNYTPTALDVQSLREIISEGSEQKRLDTSGLENVGASTSHNLTGLHGLLRRERNTQASVYADVNELCGNIRTQTALLSGGVLGLCHQNALQSHYSRSRTQDKQTNSMV
jgi:hypothetical protein